jgi:hypothetical protein
MSYILLNMRNCAVPRPKFIGSKDAERGQNPLVGILAAFLFLIIGAGCEKGVDPVDGIDFAPSLSTHVRPGVAGELLNLTGGSRVKLVWLQSRLMSEDTSKFVPKFSDYLFNAPSSQLVVFDTDEGEGRFLDSQNASRSTPLISRDGNTVYWSDFATRTLYAIDWNGSKKRILLQGDIYLILCVQRDAKSDTEWLYVSDVRSIAHMSMARGSRIYRFPVAGTSLDTARREPVSEGNFTSPWTVSADGKYGGGDMDWPYSKIRALPNGEFYQVSDTSLLTCQSEIAPDTSYLYFHFPEDHYHLAISRFTKPLTLAEINIDGNKEWDCCNPRWTNDVSFITGGYPYCSGWFYSLNGKPAPTDPRATPLGTTGEFCLGKFSADLTAITWVRITDLDSRFRKVVGDGWIAP